MLSIHLRRTGARKDAHYRVVVADSRAGRDGAFIEVLGHYHPRYRPAKVLLDVDAIKSWIGKGAQPSDTVRSLLKQIETGRLEMASGPASRTALPTEPPADTSHAAELAATEPVEEPEAEPVEEEAAEPDEQAAAPEKQAAAAPAVEAATADDQGAEGESQVEDRGADA